MKIQPKNWREFQHYKNRLPPWIRLHRSLLDNYEFHCLPVASRALAPMLWLIASESVDGVIDAEPTKLAFRLRMTEREVESAIKPLIDKSFFEVMHDASNPLASRQQNAEPESESESEREAERETDVVSLVFEHWKKTLNHPKAALDTPRRKLIRKALESYSAEDLQNSITGYSLSPFHLGKNDTGAKYTSLELVLRNAEKIDAGLSMFREPPKPQNGSPKYETSEERIRRKFLEGTQ